ncbi:MAG: undecaprenyldiphospho-muramoylpentapeptide beta-N-acetylglucosaminyltransferase [Pseudomonadota bacterium]|nr:undecaprenyldiphospho-muramoylpentapeptide beta-N-acetylglucosaminyltransferase [Pseudomonadota bacterium]
MTTKTPLKRPIVLMAGGTGGHVFPALAIAEALQKQGFSVHWLGTQRGLEARVVPAAGIPIHYITISGLRGKGLFSLLSAPFKIALAIGQSIRVLRAQRPLAVVGMGGFVTGPGGIAAWLSRIPLVIHEQNAIAGLTNRWLGRIASQVLEAFAGTFPASYRAIHTGNPLRAAIMALSAERTVRHPLHILVVGGSLGAQALNECIPQALQQVQQPISVWHQTGEAHIDIMQQAYTQAIFPLRLEAFIDDMARAYAWADLVICRAGALTVSELAHAGRASILIPYPHAVDDHQTHNAEFLVAQGAALRIPQAQLNPEDLAHLLNTLQPKQLQAMSQAACRCATPKALTQIMTVIQKTALPTDATQTVNLLQNEK